MVNEGDKVLICIEATVVKSSTGHGTCYQVEFPRKDYTERRLVWVDEEEIENVSTDF